MLAGLVGGRGDKGALGASRRNSNTTITYKVCGSIEMLSMCNSDVAVLWFWEQKVLLERHSHLLTTPTPTPTPTHPPARVW